jgi:FkbM family methyltransferase
VVAFEPLPSNADLLQRSLVENRVEDRVDLHRAAVADESGRTKLILGAYSQNSGGACISSEASVGPGWTAIPVEVVRLDDLDLPRVHFVKLDIEGAELLAIHGARSLLERDRPIIMCELHRRQLRQVSHCDARDVVTALESFDYEAREIESNGLGRRIVDVASDHPETVAFVPRY